MNEKNYRKFIIVFIVAFILGGAVGGGLCFIIHSKNKPDNSGITEYQQRERTLLERIGEYQQREEARTAREARRVEAERERIVRTETQLGAIRGLDRRSGDLLQELAEEVAILAGFFDYVRREYFGAIGLEFDPQVD
jgi:hypothetical protein